MSLPPLKIGDLIARIPIIQGAMGIGISLSNLAGAVAQEGGVGVIAGVQIGFEEPDFETNNSEANIRALKKHIKRARCLSPEGIIGVNLLAAINDYDNMVKVAVKENIDLIISGAGIPKRLPDLVKGSNTKIAPIVSSAKAGALICKLWDRKFGRVPDLVIVEGPLAGGHLGFTREDLDNDSCQNLERIVIETIKVLKPYEKEYNKSIPVIAAGGIFNGQDIDKFLHLGAKGVQMATRFVATKECDAHENFKKAYIDSSEEDIQLIKSPVGLPGRVISNQLTRRILKEKLPIKKCFGCLKPCDPKTTSYCISQVLINSCRGNLIEGLIFSGSNAHRVDEITSVKELFSSLIRETKEQPVR